jgi:hypothetical protein
LRIPLLSATFEPRHRGPTSRSPTEDVLAEASNVLEMAEPLGGRAGAYFGMCAAEEPFRVRSLRKTGFKMMDERS